MSTTATLSELLRNPSEVIDRLDEGDVVLTRRGAESLRLSREQSSSREHEMVSALAGLIAASVSDDAVAERMSHSLSEPFPWIEFLDQEARVQFVGDFLRTARACAAVGRFERLGVEVANWRETAIGYSLGLGDRIADLDYYDEPVAVEDPRLS